MHRYAHLVISLAVCAAALQAQDMRSVSEPPLPDPNSVCAVLTAQLASQNGDLTDNSQFDTGRIQDALTNCPYGGAVELQPTDSYDSFQIQPISVPPGVTLLIDPGATVFGSIDPRDYDVAPGSCGIIAASSPGCKPLITVKNAPDAAIMGGGTIDGRGGDRMIGGDSTWWELARLAQEEKLNQYNPRLLQITNSNNFVLYQITLINSPNFHVAINGGDGLTFWGVTINAPHDARNTDGIDPGNATNVTITQSNISVGDDNVAIGAGGAPASNMTIVSNYFGSGHGMSIGSYTRYGVSNVVVSNLNVSGEATDHNDNGLRIKSDSSRGGLVQNITYSNVCMKDVYNPLVFDPFYSSATGDLIPTYQAISLQNVHVLTEGRLKLEGHDPDHPLGLTLDNVRFDTVQDRDITAAYANITLGPGPVDLPQITGEGVSVDNRISNNNPPYDCTSAFPGSGPVLAVGGTEMFASIQAAVDALPATGGTVRIHPGTYAETVSINKPNVRLSGLGKSPSEVVITCDQSSGASPGKWDALCTSKFGTLFAHGDGFVAENLTIQNTSEIQNADRGTPGAQEVALYVDADRAVFRNVRIIGRHHTLYTRSKGCNTAACPASRQYFYGAYIEGSVDFIFGDAAAVFDHSTIQVVADPGTNRETTVTAHGASFGHDASGFVFIHSVLKSTHGPTRIYLGRPGGVYSTAVWLDTYMAAGVDGARWKECLPGLTNSRPGLYHAEYRSVGPGGSGSCQSHSPRLGAAEARQFEPNAYLSGSDHWQPALVH